MCNGVKAMAMWPGRIIVFVDLPKICPPKAGAAIQSDGLYAIICTVEQSLYSEPDQTLAICKGHLNYLAHQSTKIVYWSELVHNHHVPIGRTELIKEPTLYLVNVEDTFVSPNISHSMPAISCTQSMLMRMIFPSGDASHMCWIRALIYTTDCSMYRFLIPSPPHSSGP